VKKRDLAPWFHQTAALLGLELDDRDRHAPVYPGREEGRKRRRLCIARLKKPSHVVHEFAHFIDSIPSRREAPNYGLGTDPDGGPMTAYSDMLDEPSADLCELFTTFLTFALCVEAGVPWYRDAAGKRWCEPLDEEDAEDQRSRVELCMFHFAHRGIDVFDVLAHFRAGDPNR